MLASNLGLPTYLRYSTTELYSQGETRFWYYMSVPNYKSSTVHALEAIRAFSLCSEDLVWTQVGPVAAASVSLNPSIFFFF